MIARSSGQEIEMRQIYPELWQTAAEHPLAAFPNTLCNAYLLVRSTGNVLFYSTGREAIGAADDRADLDRIEELGGVGHILLGRWHEASPSVRATKVRFGATLVSHARDAPPIEKEAGVAPDVTFWKRCRVSGDIEAIPTPGHTVGSACYLYRSPHGKTYLFTGDTIWPARESWASVTFEDDGNQSSHRSSLDLLVTLEPDVVLSAVAPGETFKEIARAEWRNAIEITKAGLS
jgi:glyoxylase-like metal-dependent hydrolase (beta-lactamase superfamily II)